MKNKLYYGDNLEIMRKYISDESVDLCYIDPPFNSKRNYNQIYNNIGKEDYAQAQAFEDTWTWDSAAESGLNEIQTNSNRKYSLQTMYLINGLEKVLKKGSLFAYIISMTQRIVEIHRTLKPTGSLYLHCDPNSSHYLKIVLDSIFCAGGGEFHNEIIWCYRKWSVSQRQFVRNHDVIFFYSKEKDKHIFNTLFMQPSKGTMKRWKGKKQQAVFEDGVRKAASVDEEAVSPMADWWDISILNPNSKERLGYPTQKPEALLERIISASSDEGGIILDAFCGCGTTVAVAQRLKRKWIGIDITYQSISLIRKRLEDSYGKEIHGDIELSGVPIDRESAVALSLKAGDKTRKEFEKWAILTYSNNRAIINEKKGSDRGIDGVAFIMTRSGGSREIIFSVKSGKVNSSYIRDLRGTIERENAAGGILITLNPPTGAMVREAKTAGFVDNDLMAVPLDKIKIVTVDEILAGERLQLPLSIPVVKSAQRKRSPDFQTSLFSEDD